LNSLSGGEFDRVQLAFQLTFNEWAGTGLLLLDESISSLDSSLTSTILGELKQVNNTQNGCVGRLIVIVAHQVVEGLFDKVIDINSN